MGFKNILSAISVGFLLSSCSLWPYEKDFDCPVSEGLKCKSLYEISELADQGFFEVGSKDYVQQCGCEQLNSSKKMKNKRQSEKFVIRRTTIQSSIGYVHEK